MLLSTVALVVALATVTWFLIVPRVRVLDDEAPDFARLVGPGSTVAVGTCALLAAQVLWLVEPEHRWVWVAYLGFGIPLVAVDLRTTFLPLQLHRLAAAATGVALMAVAVSDWRTALMSVAGGVAAYLFFLIVWRLGRGLGFGDVRLAALIGAVSGLDGAAGVSTALLAGTLMGACHGIAHAVWARRVPGRASHFAYGPALWTGPLLAVLVSAAWR